MNIRDKAHHDPVSDVPQIEAYMRYALMALEEMVGTQDLAPLLKAHHLERFLGNYPPENLKITHNITHRDYANLCVAVADFYGSESKSQSIRFGRISTKPALEKQGVLFNFAARAALKLLPLSSQIKTVLDSIRSDLDKLYKDINHDVSISIEDRGTKWAYIDHSCAVCAGKESDVPICWGWVGTLEESLNWLTGKEFAIDQTECRAMGASVCTWEIMKTPKK